MNLFKHYYKLLSFACYGNKGFYAAREYMGEVLIEELEEFIDLKNKKVLDIGGERGEFCKVLYEKKKCLAVNVEPSSLSGGFVHKTIIAKAEDLPFKDRTFDIVLLRGVIQHIPTGKKLKSLKEMHRVLKPGGIAYLMIPPWYSPLSGQNIKPFQYFPFKIARHLRNSMFSSNIREDSISELGIWPMTFRSTLKYLSQTNFKVLKTIDILGRFHFLTKIPLLREVFINSAGFILQKK